MSHVVLARKYRPRNFEQMVGQAHVVQALSNALTSGRLHHAYLFTGTRGIGKTTVSRILAKSLNCIGVDGNGGVTAHPCGVCQACTEIDADRFIDYIELDAASNRSIDEIRDLIERAAYKPSVGRYKVFMIDEAHQLTKDAFNALLKTLEEPPDYLKFVLATTDPEKMLPTVLSRCLQFNLRPMAPETVQSHLEQVLQAENVAADAGSLRLLSRAARGSMRDALSLTDQAIAFGAGTLDEAGVRAMLGTVDRSHALALVRALAGRDGVAVLATVDALRQLGLSAAGTLEEMAALLQQMAVEQVVPGALDAHDPDTAGARSLATALPNDETQLLYSIVVHGRAELNLLSDEYAALTMVLLRLLAFAASGAAPLPVAAARAAPLVATAHQARGTAPARAVLPGGHAGTAIHPVAAQRLAPHLAPNAAQPTAARPSAVQPSAAQPSTAQAPAVRFGAAAAPQVLMAREPSPPSLTALRPVPRLAMAQADSAVPTAETTRTTPAAPAAPAALAVLAAPSTEAPSEPPPWFDEAVPDDGGFEGPALPFADAAPVTASPSASPPTAPPAPSTSTAPATPPPRAPASPAPTSPAMALQTTALGERWAALVRPLAADGTINALVRELAWQAELVAVQPVTDAAQSGCCWVLRVERESLRAPALSNKLAAALQTASGTPVQLQVQAGVAQDSIARRDNQAREQAQRAAEDSIHNDAAVRELMAQFATARIVPGSIKPLAADGR